MYVMHTHRKYYYKYIYIYICTRNTFSTLGLASHVFVPGLTKQT